MLNSIRYSILSISVAILITGCASIMSGKSQEISINSTPSGATVYLNGKNIGQSPVNIKVDRPKDAGQLKFEKEGYKTLEIPYQKKMNSWVLGNILFGGTFGTTTDALSGAMYEYQPGFLQVTLEPEGMTSLEKETFRVHNEIRHYILTSFNELSADLSNGGGEYLIALLSKLDVQKSRNGQVANDLLNHLTNTADAPAFVDYVIKNYL